MTIILHPGRVTSVNDDASHYISVEDLCRLYEVSTARGHDWVSARTYHGAPNPEDWHLYPRANGNYFRIPNFYDTYYYPSDTTPEELTSRNDVAPQHQGGNFVRVGPTGVVPEREWQDHIQPQGGSPVSFDMAQLGRAARASMANLRYTPLALHSPEFRSVFSTAAARLTRELYQAPSVLDAHEA